MSRLLPYRSPPRLLTEAADGCLKPPPTGRLRRVNLHLAYSMTLSRLLDTTPAADITTQTLTPLGASSRHMQRSKNHRYTISSLARRRNASGIVKLRALAVVRLMMRSNLVGCSTGGSAGFAPCRTLST